MKIDKKDIEILFNAIQDFIFILDGEGKIIHTNSAVIEKLEYTENELNEKNILKLLPESGRQEAEQKLGEILNGKENLCTVPLLTKSGTMIPVETKVSKGMWQNKEVLIGISRDISARLDTARKLKENETNYRTLTSSIPDSLLVLDREGTFMDFKADSISLSVEPKDYIGRKIDEVMPPAISKKFKRAIKAAFDRNEIQEIEYTLKINGVREQFNVLIVSVGSEKVFAFVKNISEQLLSRKKLLAQSNLQTILIKIASDYINVPLSEIENAINNSLAELGRFVRADRSYIFDYNWDKKVCNNTYEWCDEGIEPQIRELQNVPLEMMPWWVEAHKKGKTMHIPDVFKLPENDGVREILEPQEVKSLMTIPMMNKDTCIGFIGFDSVREHHQYTEKEEILLSVFSEMLVNVRQRENLEKNLVEEKKKAEMANNAKSEFLANISHEIRTPMNAILGFSEALYYKLDSREYKKMLKSVLKSGNLLLSLLNDILDLSKIEADRLELIAQPVNIASIIDEIRLLFLEKVRKNDISLSVSIDSSVPSCLLLDEIRVKQIIFNLVGNATKFTDSGYINIDSRFLPESDNKGELIIEVKDTGIGIPSDQQENIFESFKQISGQNNRNYDGVGLGLAISQRLAKKMGGAIRVESKIKKGSTFTVSIPGISLCESEMLPVDNIGQSGEILFKDATILVVDDVSSNIETVSFLLDNMGLQVMSADNGDMALQILKHSIPDLILLDIRMPGMNGYEVAKRLKQNPEWAKIPVIAFTASLSFSPGSSLPEDFDGAIYKPARKGELINTLIQYLEYSETPLNKKKETESGLSIDNLPERTRKVLHELISLLEEQHLPHWETIKDSLVLFRIENFARNLKKTAEDFEFSYLEEYANQLAQDTETFDLESLTENLTRFPGILEEIRRLSR